MRTVKALLCGLLLLSLPALGAGADDDGAKTTGALDQDFLLLPAHDLEREGNEVLQVGDRIVLKLAGINGAQIAKVEVPQGNPPLAEQGWAILSVTPVEGAASAPQALKMIVVPLKAGKLTLPSLALWDGTKAVARTNPLEFTVSSVIKKDDPKPTEPEDLRPPVGLKFPYLLLLFWVLVAGILIALAVFFWLKRARKNKPAAPAQPEAPRLPEDQEAMLALEALEKRELLKKGEFKKYYFGISEILKTYIGRRYRFDAPESTSREIITELEARGLLGDILTDKLESAFRRLDLVKFTDHVPPASEPPLVLADAREFVTQTRKPVETKVGDAVR